MIRSLCAASLLCLAAGTLSAQTNCRFVSERGVVRNLSAGEAVEVDLVGSVSGEFSFTSTAGSPAPVFDQVWSITHDGALRENGQGWTYFTIREPVEILSYDQATGAGVGQFRVPCGFLSETADTPNLMRGANRFNLYVGVRGVMDYLTDAPPTDVSYSLGVSVAGAEPDAYLVMYDRTAGLGATITGSLFLADAADQAVTYSLESSDPSVLRLPSTVTVEAGDLEADFSAWTKHEGEAYVMATRVVGAAPWSPATPVEAIALPDALASANVNVGEDELQQGEVGPFPAPHNDEGDDLVCVPPNGCPRKSFTKCGSCSLLTPSAPPGCSGGTVGCVIQAHCDSSSFTCTWPGTYVPVTSPTYTGGNTYVVTCWTATIGKPPLSITIHSKKLCCAFNPNPGSSVTGQHETCK